MLGIVATWSGGSASVSDLAARWGFALGEAAEGALQLQLTPERLQLVQTGKGAPGPVYVDFVEGALAHRRRFGGGRGQTIARAVGLKGGANPRVLDATGGLGRDAFVLASLGCTVTLLERSAVVAALLEDGLARAQQDPEIGPWIGQRMHLIHADALAWMAALTEPDFPEVVYLDPMFPHRGKSALVKKEMRLFQQLVGADADADSLLAAARRIALKRVVVKRPDYAPPLANCPPSMSIEGKKHRYDVYVTL
ncbi:MAG: class I SAM-dependent methyltransferase [Gammaproteobacteria bacterium]|nr:class I SAM-dependent methyltransferase [Gammaproteobacteria bacterium]